MIGTDILIGIAVLMILAILYIVVLIFAQRSADLSSPILQRIAGEHVNLSPGTSVPQSGYYECILCAKGGLQDATSVVLFGEAAAQRRAMARKPTRQFFDKDAIFPPCPNCRKSGGWALLK